MSQKLPIFWQSVRKTAIFLTFWFLRFKVKDENRYKTYVSVNNIEFLEKNKTDNMDKISSRTITQDTIQYEDSDLPWGD